ncbi:NACHT domain-containing protein [Parafrankia irregularis]|uniref:NACHT domain-containing protein n=1 Tax=Parafrankia irregularis TaxID=795642 RepID=UPI0013F4DEF1|nr:NACHT domain-containing protein [Parafrankia irregularis]
MTIALILAWITLAFLVVFDVREDMWWWVPDVQDEHGVDKDRREGFNVLVSALGPTLLVTLAGLAVYFRRLGQVRRFYQRKAKRNPERLVQTTGSIIGEVVGRDSLCDAIIENLRDTTERRVHIVVGGVGAGKTALLVRMTQRLAHKGAIPIPIRLRDYQKDLDFCKMARRRFEEEITPFVYSQASVDRIWRHLRYTENRIVVLADGLEEALKEKNGERDSYLRNAIRQAQEEGLPLVVTSRPHDPLKAIEAAIITLEPLSQEAAFEYVSAVDKGLDSRRLNRAVAAAGVAESPLYLQITKELNELDMLGHILLDDEDGAGDPRDRVDWQIRFDLAETWIEALVSGRLHPELPIGEEERKATVEYLSALAAVGLRKDRAEVRFDELVPAVNYHTEDDVQGPPPPGSHGALSRNAEAEDQNPNVMVRRELDRRLKRILSGNRPETPDNSTELCPGIDIRVATTWGMRMGVIEEQDGEQVRFRHSIIQAFLGSRYIEEILAGELRSSGALPDCRPRADQKLMEPGREITMALIFYACKESFRCSCKVGKQQESCPVAAARQLLIDMAEALLQNTLESRGGREFAVLTENRGRHLKVIDLYASALDVDCFDNAPHHKDIAAAISGEWGELWDYDQQTLVTAKKSLIRRMGAAARLVGAMNAGRPCYREMFLIGRQDPTYSVRFAVGQEIGDGGDAAYREIPAEGGVAGVAGEPR